MSIDDYNYHADQRNQPAVDTTVEIDGVEVQLPTRWEVCSVCDGEGKHVNPSIDAGGISAADFAEDPDFGQEYFSGTYDVTCYRCGGRTTERVVDEDRCTPEQLEAYRADLEAEADYQAERLAEIRMGA